MNRTLFYMDTTRLFKVYITFSKTIPEGNFLEPLKGRYCFFCIFDVIKDFASAV